MAATYTPGRYWCKVTNQALGETKTNKAQFVLSFSVLGKIDPANPDGNLIECPNYERSIFRVIQENTIDWLIEDIKHLCERGGISPSISGFEELDLKDQNALDLRDVEFEATCEHQLYEGEQREKWNVSRGPGKGLEVKPLEDKAIRQLNAMFGKNLKTLGKPKAPDQPTANRQAKGLPPGVTEDDLQPTGNPIDDVPFLWVGLIPWLAFGLASIV